MEDQPNGHCENGHSSGSSTATASETASTPSSSTATASETASTPSSSTSTASETASTPSSSTPTASETTSPPSPPGIYDAEEAKASVVGALEVKPQNERETPSSECSSMSSTFSSSPSPQPSTSQTVSSMSLGSVAQSHETSGQIQEPPVSSHGAFAGALATRAEPTGAWPNIRESASDEDGPSPKRRALSTDTGERPLVNQYLKRTLQVREDSRLGRKSGGPGDLHSAAVLRATAKAASEEEAGGTLGRASTSSESESGSTPKSKIKVVAINTDLTQYLKVLYVKHPPEETKKGKKPEVRKFWFPVPDEKVKECAQSSIKVDQIYTKYEFNLNGLVFMLLFDEDDLLNINLDIFNESFVASSVPAPQFPKVESTSIGRVCTTFSGKNYCALQMNSAYMDIITYYLYYYFNKVYEENRNLQPVTNPTPGEILIYASYKDKLFYRVKRSEKEDAPESETGGEISPETLSPSKESVETLDSDDDDIVIEDDSKKTEKEKMDVGGGDDDDSAHGSLKKDKDWLLVECVDYAKTIKAKVGCIYDFVGENLPPLKSIPPQGLIATILKVNDTDSDLPRAIEDRVRRVVRVRTVGEDLENALPTVDIFDAEITFGTLVQPIQP